MQTAKAVKQSPNKRREGAGRLATKAASRDLSHRALNDHTRPREITESAHDGILMMDPSGRISFWNPAAELILGYNKAEVIGKDLHKLLAPKRYLPPFEAAFPRFLRTGRGDALARTCELTTCRKGGEQIAIDLSLSAISINGEWHAIGIVREITARKRSESALKESEEKFRQLAENIREVFFALDPVRQKIIYISPAYEQIWERSREPLYSNAWTWIDAVHPDDQDIVRERSRQRINVHVVVALGNSFGRDSTGPPLRGRN